MSRAPTCRVTHVAVRRWAYWVAGLSLAISLVVHAEIAYAYQSDVHYGLTYWLAQQAGFDKEEAEAIALGNQRVDGGSIENMRSQFQYACFSAYPESARAVQALHYPSKIPVPAPASARVVLPDSPQASAYTERMLTAAKGKSAFMLQLFGKSLHPLQDAFAHRGVPSMPTTSNLDLRCDERLSMSAPGQQQRGGYHSAEITAYRPSDVLGMARATYDMLSRYPQAGGRQRAAAPWDAVSVQIESFSKAATKADKAAWFKRRGVTDVSFLDGISLPDGTNWTPVRWQGRKLPDSQSAASSQAVIAPDVLDFYRAFLTEWLTGTPKVGKLARFIKPELGRGQNMTLPLELQLWLWRLRDHGAAISVLFDESRRATARAAALALMRRPAAFARYATISDAVLPMLVESDAPSPVLPFVIFKLAGPPGQAGRVVAVVRLLDAPYETVAIMSEKTGDRWAVVGLLSTFDY